MLILSIPSQSPQEIGVTLFKLMQLSAMVNNSEELTICIDFSKTRFLNSVFLGGLFCMMRSWEKDGYILHIVIEGSPIESYLRTIYFDGGFDLCLAPTRQEDLELYKNRNYTPIVIFPTQGNQREQCINTCFDIITSHASLPVELRNSLDYFIAELTNNVAEHSFSTEGIMFIQTYKSNKYIDLCIADTGLGIYNSYINSGKYYPENEEQALEWALKGTSTKDLPESRGFGLSTSREMLAKGIGGKFIMWSGEWMFIENPGANVILKVDEGAYYKGCFLALRVPVNIPDSYNLYNYLT